MGKLKENAAAETRKSEVEEQEGKKKFVEAPRLEETGAAQEVQETGKVADNPDTA
jgi:hypothetical protein